MLRAIKSTILLSILCAVLMVNAGCKKDETWKVNSPAPQISVFDLNNATVKLSDFKGKVVVLRFWASGCKACVEEMPKLDGFRKKYREQDLAVLGVNIGGSDKLVEAFTKGLKITYPMLLDPSSIASKKYAVKMVPTTFFIDRNGNAKQVIFGEMPQKAFEQIVESLL